jgi:hypothetical protein
MSPVAPTISLRRLTTMQDEISRRSPRILIRKNTPSETRENWQFIKERGALWVRLFLALLCLALVVPFVMVIYTRGYFDGSQAVRTEIISKEKHNVR